MRGLLRFWKGDVGMGRKMRGMSCTARFTVAFVLELGGAAPL